MRGFDRRPDYQAEDRAKHDVSAGGDLAEARCTITAVDPQGRQYCGQAVLADAWRPELAQLGGKGEDFRIVILTQPLSAPLGPIAAGVAICAPGETLYAEPSLRETAAAYLVREREGQAGEGEQRLILSASARAALASGQLLATPPLALRPADVFLRQAATPRLDLLAQALVAQRAACPYLHTLAVALAAPAEAKAEAALGELFSALAELQRHIRGKAAHLEEMATGSLEVTAVLDRLDALLAATTIEAFGEMACSVYADCSELAELVYLCRALAERPQEAGELARLRRFLTEAVVPDSEPELALDRTLILEQLSAAVVVAEPQRWPGIRADFERFRQGYQNAYIRHHQRYWEAALTLHAQLLEAMPLASALRRLNTLRELGPPLGSQALADYEQLPQRMGACLLSPCLERGLKDDARCPACAISLSDGPPWEEVQQVRARLERALREQLQRLSSKAVDQILASSGEARVEQFIQLVQASQTRSLAEVLVDELLGFLRRFLVEARVRSLLAPFFTKLQQPVPDLSEEAVEALAEEVSRILQDPVAAAQQVPAAEAPPQLSPGTSPPQTG